MRTPMLALTVLIGLFAMPVAATAGAGTAELAAESSALAAQQPPEIDVDVEEGGGAWYTSPVWIAIGVIALIVLLLLIVMAVRGGGGTTVVRD